MSDLTIAPDGEVKLGYDVVGRITWATPIAYLSVAGEWEIAGSDCDCGFGISVDPDAYEELEEERDELAAGLERASDEINKLKAELARLGGAGQ